MVIPIPSSCGAARLSHTPPLVDIPPSQVNILDGTAIDLVSECNAYEERIKSHGGIDLFLGGIGEDGHIAFNVSPIRGPSFSSQQLTQPFRNPVGLNFLSPPG